MRVRRQALAEKREALAHAAVHGLPRDDGELNLLTGQNVYLLCRVREGGTVYRVSPERLRQLMATDVDLGPHTDLMGIAVQAGSSACTSRRVRVMA